MQGKSTDKLDTLRKISKHSTVENTKHTWDLKHQCPSDHKKCDEVALKTQRNMILWHVDHAFPILSTQRKKRLFSKPPDLWCFVITTEQTNGPLFHEQKRKLSNHTELLKWKNKIRVKLLQLLKLFLIVSSHDRDTHDGENIAIC